MCLSIAFASDLHGRLSLGPIDTAEIETLTGQILSNIHTVRSTTSGAGGGEEANELGRELWEQCRLLRQETDESAAASRKKLLLCTRVFAFWMLDLGLWSEKETSSTQTVHWLAQVALTAGKSCLGMHPWDVHGRLPCYPSCSGGRIVKLY